MLTYLDFLKSTNLHPTFETSVLHCLVCFSWVSCYSMFDCAYFISFVPTYSVLPFPSLPWPVLIYGVKSCVILSCFQLYCSQLPYIAVLHPYAAVSSHILLSAVLCCYLLLLAALGFYVLLCYGLCLVLLCADMCCLYSSVY